MSALEIVEGKNFLFGEEVSIDGKHFIRCRFNGCLIAYAGGSFTFTDCDLRPGGFALEGAASATVDLLRQFGLTDLTKLSTNPPTIGH